MKKINNLKAFSLAELMIVMLILTIILAATMPILSKRAKVKAAAATASKSSETKGTLCAKTVTNTPIVNVTLDPGVAFFYYTMYGGGGGGGHMSSGVMDSIIHGSGGGGGGSSAIIIDGIVQAFASGGDGGIGGGTSFYATNGSDGATASGTLTLTPYNSHTLSVYAGGGGGGAGKRDMSCGSEACGGGGGGAGYFGGGGGSMVSSYSYNTPKILTPALGGKNIEGGARSNGYDVNGNGLCGTAGVSLQGGTAYGPNKAYNSWCNYGGGASGGDGTSVGTTNTSGGGGGRYGSAGGNGGASIGTNGSTDISLPANGKGGTKGDKTTFATGGAGGSVTLFFITSASSCPSGW